MKGATNGSRWLRTCVTLAGSIAGWVGATNAAADEAPTPGSEYRTLGFSNLVFRLEDDDIVGVAKDALRVQIIEALRAEGFHTVGAEDLVFGRDDSDQAEMLLGGTVVDGKCMGTRRSGNCRIEIEWLLRSELEGRVVYRVMTRFNLMDVSTEDAGTLGKRLVLGALANLMGRPQFRAALRGQAAAPAAGFAAATLQRCTSAAHPMPGAAEAVLQATVLVRSGSGVGSGFMISPDGYMLTAEHVVQQGKVSVQTRSGQTYRATVVRADRGADAALLRLRAESTPSEAACLPLGAAPPTGTEVYAIGAPAGAELAFSLTRGIISGHRTVHGSRLLQTDASVSPGNSGGPLVDADGQAVALVRAKLAGGGIEGVAFGMPVMDALEALNLTLGEQTDPALLKEKRAAKRSSAAGEVVDEPDVRRSVDPEGDRDRLQDELTPGYVSVMKWGGATVAVLGLLTVAVSAGSHEQGGDSTYSEFQSNRAANDLGWLGLGLGVGSYVGAMFLTPSVSEADLYRRRFDVSWAVGVGSAAVRVSY